MGNTLCVSYPLSHRNHLKLYREFRISDGVSHLKKLNARHALRAPYSAMLAPRHMYCLSQALYLSLCTELRHHVAQGVQGRSWHASLGVARWYCWRKLLGLSVVKRPRSKSD